MPFIDSWFHVRAERNLLLAESDWTQLLDAPHTEEERQQWVVYYQKLRDLPQDQADAPPKEVFFPVDPQGLVDDRQKQKLVKSPALPEIV